MLLYVKNLFTVITLPGGGAAGNWTRTNAVPLTIFPAKNFSLIIAQTSVIQYTDGYIVKHY